MAVWIFRVLDALRVPKGVELFWHVLTSVSPLTKNEISEAAKVLGTGAIRYDAVRVAQGRILPIVFWFNHNRAFTLFHTINLSKSDRSNLPTVVHELLHVYQYEILGSVYIWQALRAQWTEGYSYGGWEKLAEGKQIAGYNREQQAQIVEDYYREVIAKEPDVGERMRQAYAPFIEEIKQGKL